MVDAVSCPAAHENQRDRGKLREVAAGHLPRDVARRDVGNFMRHHAGHLRLFISRQNYAGVHVEEPAGQREGVDVVRVNDFDRKRDL